LPVHSGGSDTQLRQGTDAGGGLDRRPVGTIGAAIVHHNDMHRATEILLQ